MDNNIILIISISLMLINIVFIIVFLFHSRKKQDDILNRELALIRQQSSSSQSDLRQELSNQLTNLNQITLNTLGRVSDTTVSGLQQMRNTLDQKLESIQNENQSSIEQIQRSVNEKLSESINEGFDRSFKSVSIQLDNVSRSISEVNSLGTDIQGLKNVLSNVKTRGNWGEVQLGAILKDMLSPSQYNEQFSLDGSSERVDFAVRLPGSGDVPLYLPIDSKFPLDKYEYLLSAEKQNNPVLYDTAKKAFIKSITDEAKSIQKKYIIPPYTTDFAIMYVPSEGIYSMLVEEELIYSFQRDYNIMLSGPTTLSALLSSFQLGFKNIAMQEKATEVLFLLQQVKKSLNTFYENIEVTRKNIQTASTNLEKAAGSARRLESRLNKLEYDHGGTDEASV